MEVEKTNDKQMLDDKEITTEVNAQMYDISKWMQENEATAEQIASSKIPFTTTVGPGSIQEALTAFIKIPAKVMRWQHKTPSTKELQDVTKHGLKPEEWLLFCSAMASQEGFDERGIAKLLTTHEIIQALTMINRVAHTKPAVVCARILHSRAKATFTSSCWYGAKSTLGSWYPNEKVTKMRDQKIEEALQLAKSNKEKNSVTTDASKKTDKKKRRVRIETPKKSKKDDSDSEDEDEGDILSSDEEDKVEITKTVAGNKAKAGSASESDSENEEESETEADESKDKNKHQAKTKPKIGKRKPKEAADIQAKRRQLQVRLQMKIKIKESTRKTPAQLFMKLMKKYFEIMKELDPKLIWMPWTEANSKEKVAIVDPEGLPESFSDWRIYVDRCRPKKNSDAWVKVRFATNLKAEAFTSNTDNEVSFFYDEHECAGFLCPLQNSDQSTNTGLLLYSGPFIDHVRLTHCLEEELRGSYPGKEWKIAARVKRCMEIEKPEVNHNWVMTPSQVVYIIADSAQAKQVNGYLYRRFNKTQKENNPERPGGYELLRYLPSKDFVTAGSQGLRHREEMVKKHVGVVSSLRLSETLDISKLDAVRDVTHLQLPDGVTHMTLRKDLMLLKYPLVPREGERTSNLIHSIDWAASGRDMGKKVYITACHDRADIVDRLIRILPSYIKWKYDEETMKEWCTHQMTLNQVEFTLDDEGNWTGEWVTEDDRIHEQMLNEDLGYAIEFDNMQIVDNNNVRVLAASDASFRTFGYESTEGQPTQPSDDNSTVYSVATGSIASGASGSNE